MVAGLNSGGSRPTTSPGHHIAGVRRDAGSDGGAFSSPDAREEDAAEDMDTGTTYLKT